MIISLFENNLPMRFGVILYSAKLVEAIEANDGELPVAHLKGDHGDVSSLVIYLALMTPSKMLLPRIYASSAN